MPRFRRDCSGAMRIYSPDGKRESRQLVLRLGEPPTTDPLSLVNGIIQGVIITTVRVVTAAIIRQGNKVLLAQRGSGSKLPGKWEFPGGKVEAAESLEDCLRRELTEELGIRVSVGKRLCSSDFLYDHGEFRIEAFWGEILAGELMPKVHDRIEWVAPHELRQYDLLPADIPIAEAVAAHCAR